MKAELLSGIREDRKRITVAAIALAVMLLINLTTHAVTRLKTNANDARVESALAQLTFTEDRANDELEQLKVFTSVRFLSLSEKGKLYRAMAELSYMAGDDMVYNRYMAYARYYLDRVGDADSLFYLANKYIGRLYANGSYEPAKQVLTALAADYALADFSLTTQVSYYLSCADVAQMLGEACSGYLARAEAVIAQMPANGERLLHQAKFDLLTARDHISRGDFTSAKRILTLYAQTDTFGFEPNQVYVVCDFQIPYYELMAKLYLHNGNAEAAYEMVSRYIAACDYYDFRIMKQNLLRYMSENCLVGSSQPVNPYAGLEKQAADETLADISGKYGQLLLDDIDKTIAGLSTQEQAQEAVESQFEIGMIVLCAAVLLFVLVSVLLDAMGKDSLTKLNSRKKYGRMIAECEKKKTPYCMLMLDIDDFKRVNDTFGHARGDEVLTAIAEVMLRYTGRGIHAFRYGGEELCMLFVNIPEKRAREIGEELRHTVETQISQPGMRVTISGGLAVSLHGENAFLAADKKLYEAKTDGKNKIK